MKYRYIYYKYIYIYILDIIYLLYIYFISTILAPNTKGACFIVGTDLQDLFIFRHRKSFLSTEASERQSKKGCSDISGQGENHSRTCKSESGTCTALH